MQANSLFLWLGMHIPLDYNTKCYDGQSSGNDQDAPTEAPAMITTLLLDGTGDGVGVGTVVAAELIRRKYYTLSTIVLPYDIGRLWL